MGRMGRMEIGCAVTTLIPRPLAPAEDMRSMGSVRLLLLYPSFVELDVFHAFATFDKVAVDRM